MRKLIGFGGFFFTLVFLASPLRAQSAPTALPGLRAEARIVRDSNGMPHVFAHNDHDLFFLQGWVHAQDRLFQMDVTRRVASGTLAELVGPAALASDVELRTIGLRRAAERSLNVLSPRARAALEAYAEGVNAFLGSLGPASLPPEYAPLELTAVQPWSAVDSLVIG
ncbi:MAG: penicillin acylase family protein, partial [Gemmatimonadetes bacterium]|nr:penicillin acylase family protein [Gemmatimonadota bacterium]